MPEPGPNASPCRINFGRIGNGALKILKAVYLGALNLSEVVEATGIPCAEAARFSRHLRKAGLLCCDLPSDRWQGEPEDWCVRDETREIPEMARLRGLRCEPAKWKTWRAA